MKPKDMKKKEKERVRIYKILVRNDATNEASWWQIADEVVEAIDEAVEEERVRWKKNLKQHFEQLKRSGWITNDKDMIDAINQVIE